MQTPPLLLPDSIAAAASGLRARVRAGYPAWLRPFLARDVIAITLGRTIYVSPRMLERPPVALERLLRHELAHVAQVNRLGLPVFLVRYVYEFGRNLWRLRSAGEAYRQISFEREASAAEEQEEGPLSL